MLEMRGSRSLPLALAMLFAWALVAPGVGQACASRERSCCAGMPRELAELCHQARAAGLNVPGCCDDEATAPSSGAQDATSQAPAAPALAATAALEGADETGRPSRTDRGYSRTGSRHDLGLFTLHAALLI